MIAIITFCLQLCVKFTISRIITNTSNIHPIVQSIMESVDKEMEVNESPSIQKWERFAAKNLIDLQHLHYKHKTPKGPTVAKGAVAPEAELWNSFGDKILHLDDLANHIRCRPPVHQQKKVDYATLIRFIAHRNLFVLTASIRWVVRVEKIAGGMHCYGLYAECPIAYTVEQGNGSSICTQINIGDWVTNSIVYQS